MLDTLSTSKIPLTELVKEDEGSIDIRQSALDKQLTGQDVLTLAMQTLQHVFRFLRGPSVRQALVPFFEYVFQPPAVSCFRSCFLMRNIIDIWTDTMLGGPRLLLLMLLE